MDEDRPLFFYRLTYAGIQVSPVLPTIPEVKGWRKKVARQYELSEDEFCVQKSIFVAAGWDFLSDEEEKLAGL